MSATTPLLYGVRIGPSLTLGPMATPPFRIRFLTTQSFCGGSFSDDSSELIRSTAV